MVLRLSLLLASVLQVVAPVVTFLGPGRSPAQSGVDGLLVAPAGYAFAIWGPIYALAVAHAVAALLRRPDVPRRLFGDLLTLYVAGAVWIAAAGVGSSVATAVVLLVMAVAAVDGVLTAARTALAPGWFATLTRVAVGLYAGWVTAALFVNLSSALAATDAVAVADRGWQLVVLVVAALTAAFVLAGARGNLAYAAATAWAFVAIAVTTAGTARTFVVVSLLAAVCVAALAVVATVRERCWPGGHHPARGRSGA